MLKQQFQLAYHAGIDYSATEFMPSEERNYLYRQLVETKKEEEREANKSKRSFKRPNAGSFKR